MGKNVAVFVDVANIFYAAKAAGVDIDYVTLLKAATAGRDFVRAYAYTGLDPDNENQRNFHQFLARHQYKVVSKDIRKYGDGKVKANLDIELVVDLMKTARNLDIAVIVSGDGDFASAIRAVQEMGVRCEVISFRGNTSSDLIEVADLFTDITQIAKVDKSSTQSGRRVANDDEDLSMTEVPEKQSEGTGRGRGRGRDRDRDRGRGGRDEVAASPRGTYSRSASSRSGVSSRTRSVSGVADGVGESASGGRIVALPGEKLSRAAAIAAAAAAGEIEVFRELDDGEELDVLEVLAVEPGTTAADGETEIDGEGEGDGRRRRRRRGGRGRGRGRRDGVAEGAEVVEGEAAQAADADDDIDVDDAEIDAAEAAAAADAAEPVAEPARASRAARPTRTPRTASGELPTPFDDLDALEATPRSRRATPFGSVWDRQIGTPARPVANLTPIEEDEEDLEEPEIPEYLLAERRRGPGGQGGRGGAGGRGGGARSAYAAAIERERYGGARGTSSGRLSEPARGSRAVGSAPVGGGRSGQQPTRGPRFDRTERVDRAPRVGGDEPWSEVPPELEQQLLAQLGRGRPAASTAGRGPVKASAPAEAPAAPKARAPRRAAATAAAAPAEAPVAAPAEAAAPEAPKRRTAARKPAAAIAPEAVAPAPAPAPASAPAEAPAAPKARAPRRAAATAAAAPAEAPVAAPAEAAAPEAPKRRTAARKPVPAAAIAPEGAAPAPAPAEAPAPPKARATRRKASDAAEG